MVIIKGIVMYIKYFKRLFDIFLALIGLIILIPLFLLITIAIKIESKGSVIFKQKRIGKSKKLFYLYKFRTMRSDAPPEVPTHMLSNPNRYITTIGKFLRKTSLDELPQIINILRGEMGIIGPRPALWNQYDLISERDKYGVNDIRPGLTGWAQVNGRDELPIEVKAKLDGEYCMKLSFYMDCRCILLSVIRVLKGEGVIEGNSGGEKTQSC